MKTYYQSMTMGNLVSTKHEIIKQIIESLFKFHTFDLKWEKINIRYYVCGIGYDANDCVTDYEHDFGDFDTVEEARECFFTALHFRDDEPEVAYWKIQLEKCEETKDCISCIDVIEEEDIEKEMK